MYMLQPPPEVPGLGAHTVCRGSLQEGRSVHDHVPVRPQPVGPLYRMRGASMREICALDELSL